MLTDVAVLDLDLGAEDVLGVLVARVVDTVFDCGPLAVHFRFTLGSLLVQQHF